ncbi:MAG: Asp-tRNA(Asn)/Glu-tRNA(Gln) amidotransferase subunit GatC [Clostridia bacterium]|nr:Asp-tRNA(Asn)/Glu-tRNA(Gln) amidotransferase subunit GatC [Clostridia bacterium]
MEKETLIKLEKLNQLRLDDTQKISVIDFFAKRDSEMEIINSIDTKNTERMVHVMPILTVVRDDVEKKLFTRDQLQKGAPETMDGYWQVPRLVE